MSSPLFSHPKRAVSLAALFAFLAASVLGFIRRDGMLSGDEMAYRFQARIFASGRLTAALPPGTASGQAPPPQLQFAHHLITPRGWYGMYPVGWPLTLALGTALHAGWLVNPLLGALLIWLTWRLARLSFDQDTAVLAALLLSPCPFFFVNTSGDMSHALAACVVTAALCFAEIGLARPHAPALALSIALLGLCLCIRPFTAVASSIGVGVVLLFRLLRDRLLLLRLVPWALAAAVLALALAALQNHHQTGSYLKSGYALYAGKSTPEEISFDIPAVLAKAPRETASSLASTVFNSTPFLFVFAGFALSQPSIPRGKSSLLASVFAGSVFLYMLDLVPNASLPGQRMYFEGLPGVAVLAAAGFTALRTKWNVSRTQLRWVFLLFAALQLTHFVLTARDIQTGIAPAVNFNSVLRQASCTNCVVFMQSEDLNPSDALAPRNFNINSADWPHASHVYLIDPGPALRQQVAHEWGRPQWALVVYDGMTGLSTVRQTGAAEATPQ